MTIPEQTHEVKQGQEAAIGALKRLEVSLCELNDQISATNLSHFRIIPDPVGQSYSLMEQGAALVHSTSTKFTLVGKIDLNEQCRMLEDLLKGCQLVATGCVALHDNSTGTCRALRRHTKHASRAIVHTVLQLIECFHDMTALEEKDLGAQKTGAVWATCDCILQKKMPRGNRNAMRRDFLTFAADCNQTMEEFQELIDLGPTERGETEVLDNSSEDAWDAFLGGEEQQYTDEELKVATVAVGLVKCSRGTLNGCLQACDAVGSQIQENAELSDDDKNRLNWIAKLYDLVFAVGEGMTDLGATLYPPIDLSSVSVEINRQCKSIDSTLQFLDETSSWDTVIDLPIEVKVLVSKLRRAVQARANDALELLPPTINTA